MQPGKGSSSVCRSKPLESREGIRHRHPRRTSCVPPQSLDLSLRHLLCVELARVAELTSRFTRRVHDGPNQGPPLPVAEMPCFTLVVSSRSPKPAALTNRRRCRAVSSEQRSRCAVLDHQRRRSCVQQQPESYRRRPRWVTPARDDLTAATAMPSRTSRLAARAVLRVDRGQLPRISHIAPQGRSSSKTITWWRSSPRCDRSLASPPAKISSVNIPAYSIARAALLPTRRC